MIPLFQLLVLKYIANKDVFMRFHKAHLSRRLILDMSADQEKEEAMVNKLRVGFHVSIFVPFFSFLRSEPKNQR